MKARCLTVSSLTCLLLEDMMKRWHVDIKAKQGLAKTQLVTLQNATALQQVQFWQGPGCLHFVGKAATSFTSVKVEDPVQTSVIIVRIILSRSCSRILM